MQDYDRTPDPRPTLMGANSVYLFAAAGTIILGLVLSLMIMMLRDVNPEADVTWLNNMYQATYEIALLAFPALFYLTRHPSAADAFRLNPLSPSMLLVTALLAVVGVFLMSGVGTAWSMLLQRMGAQLRGGSLVAARDKGELAGQVLLVGVIPGVCEELLFRSYIFSAWERRGARTALIVSSLLFTGLHGSVEGLPIHLLTAFVLGWLAFSSGSVYTSMVYHTTYNAMLVILTYIQPSSADDATLDVAAYVAQNGGTGALLGQIGVMGALFGLILWLMSTIWRGRAELCPPAQRDARPMDWRALTVLIAAVVTVLCVYLLDVLALMGVPVGL